MIKSRITFRKIALLIGEVLFYSIAICSFFLITNDNISTKAIVNSLLPINRGSYWFITTYVGLMLLSPILNQALLTFSKKQFQTTIGLLLMLVFWFCDYMILLWFILLYVIAAYIRLYVGKSEKLAKCSLLLALSMIIILAGACWILPATIEYLNIEQLKINNYIYVPLTYLFIGKFTLYILILSIV